MGKILLLNGSPKANGCTAAALAEMVRVFEEEGMETELVQVGRENIRGCLQDLRIDLLAPAVEIFPQLCRILFTDFSEHLLSLSFPDLP